MKVFLSTVLIICLIATSNQKLKVLSPEKLADEIEGQNIEFIPAHYGDLPYGGSLVGFLHKSNSVDGCSPIDHINPYDHDDNQPILIVKRGGCPFLTKSLHAQHAGAKMLIVTNDTDLLNYDPIANDVTKGAKVKIPTVFVSKDHGDKLLEYVNSSGENDAKGVILQFTLPLPSKDFVTLQVVMTADDKSAFNF